MFNIKETVRKLWTLFITFFKIGAFTFGGGYAMIPLISKEVVEKNKWVTDKDILDVIAIAESTPGPIAINSSTFVGYKVCGYIGAFFATLGMTLPSLIIITIISFFLEQFMHLQVIQFAFMGIRVGVVVLVIKALFTIYKQCPKNAISYVIMLFAFVSAAILKFNILLTLIICAVTGLISSLLAIRRAEK